MKLGYSASTGVASITVFPSSPSCSTTGVVESISDCFSNTCCAPPGDPSKATLTAVTTCPLGSDSSVDALAVVNQWARGEPQQSMLPSAGIFVGGVAVGALSMYTYNTYQKTNTYEAITELQQKNVQTSV